MPAIFLAYWLISRQYTGPAYLSDEIGYLTKAAVFAGHPVDMASSWHGGYSLLLAPLFMVFSDPFTVWQGIMVVNALFWVSSFMLLFYMLKRLFPEQGFWAVFFAVAFSSIYPSWVTMSGYAFSTPAFVLFFLLSIIALLFYSHKNLFTLIPYSFFVGYLYWIHPTGLAVVVASLLVIAVLSWHNRRVSGLLLHFCILVMMVGIYKYGIHAWLSQVMTPENYSAQDHYGSISKRLEHAAKPEFFVNWMIIFCGQVSYLLISTFGILLFSFSGIHNYYSRLVKISDIDAKNLCIFLFLVLSLLGILLMGAMFFAGGATRGSLRIDQWIYGRYSEPVVLPLLGIALISAWKFRLTLFSSLFVFFSGLVLYFFSNDGNTSSFNNLINIQSFWPQALFPGNTFSSWFALGILGIILTSILKKRFIILLAAPLFFVAVSNQISWHSNILSHYSKPTAFFEFIKDNYPYGSCIGFTPERPPSGSLPERRNMYSYYFFNYNLQRMSYSSWVDNCEGPYLTFDENPFIENDQAAIIAREENSGLYLAVKRDQLDKISAEGISMTGVQIDLSGNVKCLIQGCFSMSASDLSRFSQVGELFENALETTGHKGFLFYGPYRRLKTGSYYVSLDMALINPDESRLDIVHNKGADRIIDVDLSNYATTDSGIITIPFELKNDVNDVEVRLHVSENTALKVFSYSILLNDGQIQIPTPTSYLYRAASPAIKSNTGVLEGGRLYSNETAGFLAFGPYKPLGAGKYEVIVSGEASRIEQAFVDVVSGIGQTVHAKFMLSETVQEDDGVLLRSVFVLNDDVQDIEIRLWTSKEDIIILDGYSIHPVQ